MSLIENIKDDEFSFLLDFVYDQNLTSEQKSQFQKELKNNEFWEDLLVGILRFKLKYKITTKEEHIRQFKLYSDSFTVETEANYTFSNNKKNKFLFLKIAAIFILFFSITYLTGSFIYSDERLIEKYGEIESYSAPRSTELLETIEKQIETNYFEGNYQKVTEIFDQSSSLIKPEYYLYLGWSNMHQGNNKQAIGSFQYVIEHGNKNFHHIADWYIGISYLKNNNSKDARQQFKKIKNEKNHSYQKKAKKLYWLLTLF